MNVWSSSSVQMDKKSGTGDRILNTLDSDESEPEWSSEDESGDANSPYGLIPAKKRSVSWKPPDALKLRKPCSSTRNKGNYSPAWKPPQLPGCFSNGAPSGASLVILQQPELQHRARYMSEGSRGAVKDKSGKSHVLVQLAGHFKKPIPLEVFAILNDPHSIVYHPLYKVIPVLGKGAGTSTPCIAVAKDNVDMLQVMLRPEEGMQVLLDCLGILKVCGYKVKPCGTKGQKLSSRAQKASLRLAFRVNIDGASAEESSVCEPTTLTMVSDPIRCVQQLGQPEVTKCSLRSCPPQGGQDLFLIGRNFSKSAVVAFQEINEDGKTVWSCDAPCHSNYSHQCHLVCTVPTYRSLFLSEPVTVSFRVVCEGKTGNSIPFQYSVNVTEQDTKKLELQESSLDNSQSTFLGSSIPELQSSQQSMKCSNDDASRRANRKRSTASDVNSTSNFEKFTQICSSAFSADADTVGIQQSKSQDEASRRIASHGSMLTSRAVTSERDSFGRVLPAANRSLANSYLSSLLLSRQGTLSASDSNPTSRLSKAPGSSFNFNNETNRGITNSYFQPNAGGVSSGSCGINQSNASKLQPNSSLSLNPFVNFPSQLQLQPVSVDNCERSVSFLPSTQAHQLKSTSTEIQYQGTPRLPASDLIHLNNSITQMPHFTQTQQGTMFRPLEAKSNSGGTSLLWDTGAVAAKNPPARQPFIKPPSHDDNSSLHFLSMPSPTSATNCIVTSDEQRYNEHIPGQLRTMRSESNDCFEPPDMSNTIPGTENCGNIIDHVGNEQLSNFSEGNINIELSGDFSSLMPMTRN